MRPPHALVIGAGVSGLTTAVCLAEAGLTVQIRTMQRPLATTSCAAAAIWGPYLADDARIQGWSETTLSVLTRLTADRTTGVRLAHGLEASRRRIAPPRWMTALPGFRPAEPEELPLGYASGWWYTAPVVDMPVYLSYLTARLRRAGGTIELGRITSLRQAVALAPVVVNCAGAGARDLAQDPALVPVRGELVVVENPGLRTFFMEHEDSPAPTYYLPHGDHVALGGSAEPGRTDLAPDQRVAAAILERCAAVEPSLAGARVVAQRVGIRPSRSRVRLEATALDGRLVVHNYGHGGAGVTVSWGCARHVLGLVHERVRA